MHPYFQALLPSLLLAAGCSADSAPSQGYGAPLTPLAPSQGYGAPLAPLAPSQGYGAPLAPLAPSQGYGEPLAPLAPGPSQGYGAPLAPLAPSQGYGAPLAPLASPYRPAQLYHEEPHPYSYSYGVHDDFSGSNFEAGETADGAGKVEGEYSVLLPDGRTQHVSYHADHHTGYVAEVTYDAPANYPEQQLGYGQGHV